MMKMLSDYEIVQCDSSETIMNVLNFEILNFYAETAI